MSSAKLKTYFNLLIKISEVDEAGDHVRDVCLPLSCPAAGIGTENEAKDLAAQLYDIGEAIHKTQDQDEWRMEIINGDTLLGYQEWKNHIIDIAIGR